MAIGVAITPQQALSKSCYDTLKLLILIGNRYRNKSTALKLYCVPGMGYSSLFQFFKCKHNRDPG